MTAKQPQKDRCVLTKHDVQSIKDLVFVVGSNSESSAQKAIFEILANNTRRSRQVPAGDNECTSCVHNGLRSCMYHGYGEGEFPKYCVYKIGTSAMQAQLNLPTRIQRFTKDLSTSGDAP